MILLEKGNRILGETVRTFICKEEDEKLPLNEVTLCDFDDVHYKVEVEGTPEGDATEITIRMDLPFYDQIIDTGGKDALLKAFGDMVVDGGATPTIKVDLTKMQQAEEKEKEDLIDKISKLKSIVVGGCFEYYLRPLAEEKDIPQDCQKYDFRSDTTVYFVPRKAAVTVIMGLNFDIAVDKVIIETFMTLFCTKNVKPPTRWYSADVPGELKEEFQVTQKNHLGYIVFSLSAMNVKGNQRVSTDVRLAQVIHVLQTFRSFMQYHLKMSKSYWHSRMRARCKDMIKILNRAKMEDPTASDNKKTASGKTFKR